MFTLGMFIGTVVLLGWRASHVLDHQQLGLMHGWMVQGASGLGLYVHTVPFVKDPEIIKHAVAGYREPTAPPCPW